jgi:5-methylcytosine-specific restriction endonuclease McrA
MSNANVLALNAAGAPHQWLDLNRAAHDYASDLVAWEAGETEFVLHGGICAATGRRSTMRISSIVALKGKVYQPRQDTVPTLSRVGILMRDRYVCAYCAQRFPERLLDVEHIIPSSRGGQDTWMNLVAACKACNSLKMNRTPEEVGLRLCYVPYVPNRYEAFILGRKRILGDQMRFLRRGVGKESRFRPQ